MAASVADAAVCNSNHARTVLTSSASLFFINGRMTFINRPRNPPFLFVIYSLVCFKKISLFPKSLITFISFISACQCDPITCHVFLLFDLFLPAKCTAGTIMTLFFSILYLFVFFKYFFRIQKTDLIKDKEFLLTVPSQIFQFLIIFIS